MDRQYQHSSHSGRGRRPEKGRPANEPVDHALGRSKGGFGTQLQLLSDGQGLVLAVGALPGQAHESTQFERVASSVRRIRQWLRRHGIAAVIAPKRARGRRRRGRPVSYDASRYRGRSAIECGIGVLKECRSVATRYEKLALHYLGLVKLAIIERYLRLLSTVPNIGAT